MRRGFKSTCEVTAKRYRKRLGVSLQAALPYRQLADELGVFLWAVDDVTGLDDDTIHQLSVADALAWSAVTVRLDERYAIVVNTAQNQRRIPNSVVHELAHIMLGHSAARVDISEDGHLWLSTYDEQQEREADWLSATLLLPRDGLLRSFVRQRDIESIAAQFRVSRELVRWRLNATGVARQVEGDLRSSAS